MPPGFYVSQFTALDTHALLIMIMHDALKGPACENCLSESQMPRANFSQLTKRLPRERHWNFMLYGFGITFFIHSLGTNAESR